MTEMENEIDEASALALTAGPNSAWRYGGDEGSEQSCPFCLDGYPAHEHQDGSRGETR